MIPRHVVYPVLMIIGLVLVIFADGIYVMTFTGIAGVAVLIQNRRYQQGLDRRAQQIMDAVAAASSDDLPDRFVLYLRPFDLDQRARKNRLNIAEILFGGFGFLAADRQWSAGINSEIGLQKGIAEGLERPLLVVSDPRDDADAQGAAAVRLDADWQDRVARLIDAADAVIFVPAQSTGARYELSLLEASTARLEKTVFLIPNAAKDKDHGPLQDNAFDVIQDLGAHRGFPHWHRLPRNGVVLRFVHHTVQMIEAEEIDGLLMSFSVLAMCQEITGRKGLAHLNRPLAPPVFFARHELDDKTKDEIIRFQQTYSVDWDIKTAVITRDALSKKYVDYLSMVFTHNLQIFAADYISRQAIAETDGLRIFVQVDPAHQSRLELATNASMILPFTTATVEAEITGGEGRFVLTKFGETCVRLIPVWIRLRDATRENPVVFDAN